MRADHLVVSNIKAWEGAIAVSSGRDVGCVASNRFLTYQPIDDRIDVGWARWYFLSEPGIRLLGRASPGSADRNRTLAIDRFEALTIPLPPIDEQRRVAAHLDRIEAAAGQLRQRAAAAVTLSVALAVSLAARPDLDGAAKERAGWRRRRLGSLMAAASERIAVDPDKSYRNVGIYSFGRGLFAKPDIEGSRTATTTLHRIHQGQFIYSRLFAFEGAYAFVPPAFDGCHVSNEFPSFNLDADLLDARWLASALRSPSRWAELRGRSKGLGVRRQRVPVEAVLDYVLDVPPIATQRRIVVAIDRDETAGANRDELKQRIDALVPAAINATFASLS